MAKSSAVQGEDQKHHESTLAATSGLHADINSKKRYKNPKFNIIKLGRVIRRTTIINVL